MLINKDMCYNIATDIRRSMLYYSMSKTLETKQNCEIAEEIFKQLQASRVNGFPFFAYTGIEPSIFSVESLHLKLPKNPSPFKSILVMYEYDSDTYKVSFYTHDDPLKKENIHRDIYADGLTELIVGEMGVN